MVKPHNVEAILLDQSFPDEHVAGRLPVKGAPLHHSLGRTPPFDGRMLFGESRLIYISLYKNTFDS